MTERFTPTQIKIAIIGGVALFFSILFLISLARLGVFKEDQEKQTLRNDRIVFDQPKLSIFDETRYINQYPDTIHMHYPYFIVVVPEDTKQITTVYDFNQKRAIASFNDIVLDYYNGNFLYNYHGGNTYYKGKNLGVHCTQGFIKSSTEILCVIQNSTNSLYSDLIIIDPQTLITKTLYSPQNAITAIYYDKNTLYLGEYDYNAHQAYLTINGKRSKVNTFINIIYPRENNMFIGTFKNDNISFVTSYSQLVSKNGQIANILQSKGEITFY